MAEEIKQPTSDWLTYNLSPGGTILSRMAAQAEAVRQRGTIQQRRDGKTLVFRDQDVRPYTDPLAGNLSPLFVSCREVPSDTGPLKKKVQFEAGWHPKTLSPYMRNQGLQIDFDFDYSIVAIDYSTARFKPYLESQHSPWTIDVSSWLVDAVVKPIDIEVASRPQFGSAFKAVIYGIVRSAIPKIVISWQVDVLNDVDVRSPNMYFVAHAAVRVHTFTAVATISGQLPVLKLEGASQGKRKSEIRFTE